MDKVFPEMVSTDERGYKAVNYSELPYLMLQAIRELKAENDTLHEQVEKLKDDQTEVRGLHVEMEQLKAALQKQSGALAVSLH